MSTPLLEEAKSIIGMIEEYKNEIEALNLQKEGLKKVYSHIEQSIRESEAAVIKIIDMTSKNLSNLSKLSALNEALVQKYPGEPLAQESGEILKESGKLALDSLALFEFQDILAQRLQKATEFLSEIEKRILRLILLFGIHGVEPGKRDEISKKIENIAWEREIAQEDVDAIFKELGL